MGQKVKVTLNIDAEVSNARKSLSQLSQYFDKIGGGKQSGILSTLEQLDKELTKLENKSGTTASKVGDFSSAEKSTERINQLIKKLSKEMETLGKGSGKELIKCFSQEAVGNIEKASQAIKTYTNYLKSSESKTGTIGKVTAEYQKQTDKVNELKEKISELNDKKNTGTSVDQSGYKQQKNQIEQLNQAYDEQVRKMQEAEKARNNYLSTGGRGGGALKNPSSSKPYQKLDADFQASSQKVQELQTQLEAAKNILASMYIPSQVDDELEKAQTSLTEAQTKVKELQNDLDNTKTTEMNKALEEAKKKLEGITGLDLGNITSLEDLEKVLEQLTSSGLKEFESQLNGAKTSVEEMSQANEQMSNNIRTSRDALEQENNALRDVEGLKSRIQYYFSLANGAYLIRSAIQQAIEVVKELDEAMTETAVVTDFSVGDMWEKLPEYTKLANELGVSTQGVYEASTLYYQQGLQTEEVMALTTETLKMARIAGLECADATDLMTAALRGFNMELNETSTQRVNDVYSELAAITAADTEEIATAMTKTASIAHSANMEFETTAAFLSQIIETTREPAETAGTAMKTIIARFTEMKQATTDIIDVDGEEVSVNKVDAALQSVGVSLKDANGEFRDLDDVLLELASKWDTIDIMSQRYVATMAAGSRQQSRFIAMMQDYERTMELVNAAYNSTGASAAQFEKTQESLETKMERLANAWNSFLMGISNSTIIKAVIDLLAGLLTAINKLTTVPESLPFNGIATSVLKLATAIGLFKAASKGIDKIFALYQTRMAAIKEMNSINLTGGFSNGAKASPEDAAAAKNKNKSYFKKKSQTGGVKVPVEIDADEAKSAKEGAKNGTVFAEAAETAAKSNPIESDSNNIDAETEGSEYGTLFYRTAQGEIIKTPFTGMADLENAYNQGAEWARVYKNGVAVEMNGDALQEYFGEAALLESSLPTSEVPALLPHNPKYDTSEAIETAFEGVSPVNKKKSIIGESFSKGMEESKEKTEKFFASFKRGSKGAEGAVDKLKGGVKNTTSKMAGGFGKVVGVLSGIPPVAYVAVGAVAALAAAIYVAWYTSDDQVFARRLEEATKETERLTAATQELSQSITNIKESYSELSDQKKTLNSLVEGTVAWKEALLENNRIVLELVKNYPELREYMTIGDNGEYSISQEGYNSYLGKKLSQLSSSQTGQYYAQAYQDYLTEEKNLREWNEENGGTLYLLPDLTGSKFAGMANTSTGAASYSFESMYSRGYTSASDLKEKGWTTYNDQDLSGYRYFVNAKDANRLKYAKTIAAKATEFLDDDATELERSVVKSVAEDLALEQSLEQLDGKIFKGKAITASDKSSKKDMKDATAEDVKALTDEELALAGYEWVDENKEALKVIGSDSTTTFEVTQHGHTDTEDNLTYWLGKNKKNVNIDAGWIMAEVASKALPQLSNRAAAAIVEGADEVFLRLLNGEILSTEEVKKATEAANEQYRNINKQIDEQNKLKSKLESEGKADQFDSSILDGLSASKQWFEELSTQSNELSDLNNSNKEELVNTLNSYGFSNAGNWEPDQLNDYKKVIDHFSETTSTGTSAIYAFNKAYSEFAKSNDSKKALTDFAQSLSTSSAIEGYKQLIEGTESADQAVQDFSQTMVTSSKRGGFYSGLNQLKELVTSEDFSELSSQLSDLAKEGNISASNVLDLADSSEILAQALDAGALSAGALAKIFQEMTEDNKDLNDFTQDYINYLNKLTESATQAAKALKFVQDFKMPTAQTSAQESWESWATELEQRAAAGAYNDQVFTALLENFASKEQWEKWEKENTIIEERYNELKSLIDNSTKGSYQVLLAGANKNEEGATYLKNGQLTFNLSEYKSTEGLIKGIAEQYEISEEYARQLITDARIYNTVLNQSLNKMDKQNAFLQDFYIYGTKNDNGKYDFKITDDFAKTRGYDDAQAYISSFEETVKNENIELSYSTNEMTKNSVDIFKSQVKKYMEDSDGDNSYKIVGAGQAAGLTDEEIIQQATVVYKIENNVDDDDTNLKELQEKLQNALTSAQDVADAEQDANIAEQAAQIYDSYYDAVSNAMKDAMTGLAFPITIKYKDILGIEHSSSGTFSIGEATSEGQKNNDYSENADEKKENAQKQQEAYTETQEELAEAFKEVIGKSQGDVGISGYSTYSAEDGSDGSSDEDEVEVEKRNYASENADKQLEALERVRETNDREAELIDKLPEEIQFPLKMANMAEDMAYEYQEIQINKNKLAALESERALADADAIEAGILGEMGSGLPIYYDELLGSYMWDIEAMNNLTDEELEKAYETKDALDELNESIKSVEQELDGGKVQAVFHTAGKASKAFSKALKDTKGETDDLGEAFEEIGDKIGLGDQFKKLGQKVEDVIDSSETLDKEFEGLGIVSEETLSKLDDLPLGDDVKNLIKHTLGTNEGGTVGSWMGDFLGASGGALTGLGDVLNFDMMSMGLDMANQMKGMADQTIQYVVQFVQTIVNWWTNREDWLYNLLSAIEQEVRNFNRQGEVEERFRLYSNEGLDDLVTAWNAMRASLEKQIELNEQLIASRQAELQFLNLTNLPFSPAFYYDYEEERVIENPWVYDIYVLLLDIGAMIPGIGGIFSSVKQLMEDNKQRMESAVQEIEDARDEILELEKEQLELRTKYMEDEIELEELVMDTIIEKQQEEIDELSAMNDAITEGNEKLIEALNDKLEKIREQRDNEDREEELGEKERRLAYLRQDTSGANLNEIRSLQKELKDERRDYTDELIDQKISALEDQNKAAAEQRQKQIDLLQDQLDYTEKYGLQWEEAQTLIKNGFDSEGRLRVGTDLYNMLMSKEEFTSMGNGSTRQTQQLYDWNVTGIAAAAFREINDVWNEGFGHFTMSNDVHDQSALQQWSDVEIDYRELPSWLSFLQPAYNSIQEYLWRTNKNLDAFVETAYLSDKNSSSILGKTLIPLIQNIAGGISDKIESSNSLSMAETGYSQVASGAIIAANERQASTLSWGERAVKSLTDTFAETGNSIVGGISRVLSSNSIATQSVSEKIGDTQIINNFNMNSDDGDFVDQIVDIFRTGNVGLKI